MPPSGRIRLAITSRVVVVFSACLVASLMVAARVEAADVRFGRVPNVSGISHNSVYAMMQDREGFVWFGTADGLDRFDGHDFVIYSSDPTTDGSLANPVVRALCEDRGGFVWVGTEGGLFRLDAKTHVFEAVPLHAGGTANAKNVFALFEDGRGRLWAGTDRGVFVRRDARRGFEPVHVADGGGAGSPREVSAFDEDPEGHVWALVHETGGDFIETVEPGLHRRLRIEPGWGYVASFAIDRDGRLWMKPPHSTVIDPGATSIPAPDGTLNDRQILSVIEARDGSIWFGLDRGFCRASPGGEAVCHPIVREGNWLQNIGSSLLEDRSGAVWIGTFGGPRRWDPLAKPFEIWKHDRADPESLGADAVSSVFTDEDGIVWVGTFGGGLNRLDRATGRVVRFRHDPGDTSSIPHDVIWSIHGDDDGALWLGTEEGFARFDRRTGKSRIVRLPTPPRPTLGRYNAVAADDRGVLWIAGPFGLYRFDPRTGDTSFIMPPHSGGLAAAQIESILPRHDGIWLGTGVFGLRSYDPDTGTFAEYPFETPDGKKLRSEGLWSLHEDRVGVIWIGSGVGLSRFDPRSRTFRHFFRKDGLPGSIVYSVEEDGEGRLWLGTNRGLVRSDADATGRRRFRTFDVSDGIAGMEFNRNAVHRAASGELFFGGLEGLTVFDPREIRDDPRKPPLALTSIEVLGSHGPRNVEPRGLRKLTLHWGDDPFGFDFVALSFANPERNRYRYRLVGFDREWIDTGSRRFARYTNVPPGDYLFRVAGSNQDGIWNEDGVALPVTILPPFWMTLWFRAIVAAMAGALLWALYHVRVSRLVEMERLRLRIASDLHDDLSSELSGISVTAELIRREATLDSDARTRLALLRDKAVEMAGVMRDTAWSIHPEHDTIGATVRRMRETAATLLADVDLEFDVGDLPADRSFGMTARRNLFLVFKELVHNVARHAGASRVTIRLDRVGDALRLSIEDNGKGFDPAAAGDGDGLRNIRRRAEQMGGWFEIDSAAGRGTRAAVAVPLD